MKIVMFYHSLLSDWNHGNAHFLRGIAFELKDRHNEVHIYEPEDGWSMQNLVEQKGKEAVKEFYEYYPDLESCTYRLDRLDLDKMLDGASLVIVHEWNEPELVKLIGQHRKLNTGYRLLFHDTHHRSLTDFNTMSKYDLSGYDGVLAYGNVIREIYLSHGWADSVWTWHEAADVRLFHPYEGVQKQGDLIWIGNWGDEERTQELYEYFLNPVKDLGINATAYGVRYPGEALSALRKMNIHYGGWLPNFKVPLAFAAYKLTVHVPRRPYVESLPGIPTIRPFEALACGIPLICSPWQDSEGLFRQDMDFLIANNGNEMKNMIKEVLNNPELAQSLSIHGRETILNRHTCAHRVDQLMEICAEIGATEYE